MCLACENIWIGSLIKCSSFWNNPFSFQLDHLGRMAHWLTNFMSLVPFYISWKPLVFWYFQGVSKRPMAWNESLLFTPVTHFCSSWKRYKTKVFQTFSGGIEMGHWCKKGEDVALKRKNVASKLNEFRTEPKLATWFPVTFTFSKRIVIEWLASGEVVPTQVTRSSSLCSQMADEKLWSMCKDTSKDLRN